jgi:hypothetical protein
MDCRLFSNGSEYSATIRNISLNGAFLWSAFMPAAGSKISIKIESSLIKNPLSLEGHVIRNEPPNKDQEGVNAFAMKFQQISLSLFELIGKLFDQQSS